MMKLPIEFLTQRLGISREDYDAIQAGDPSAIADRFSDPFMAAMFSSMLRRNGSAHRDDVEEGPDRELLRARMIIRRLKMEIATTRVILQRVAQIAGACPRCLGLNGVCPHCQGRGHPGCRQPEQEEFLSWIAPALGSLNLEGTTAPSKSGEVRENRKENV